MKELALQVTKARADQGLTIQELAGKAQLTRNTVADIEDGDYKHIGIKDLVAVAKALGMCIDVKFVNVPVEDDGGKAMTARPPRTDSQSRGTGI